MSAPAAAAAAPSASGLSASEFVLLALKERTQVNHNTDLFTFALKDGSAKLDLPVSSCIFTSATVDGEAVMRPYTPIQAHDVGVMHLLVKRYAEGKMSKHIHSLKVGDTLSIKGPIAKKPYTANTWTVGMISGGTGITPMLQVLDQIFANPEDKTKVTLLFANSTAKDVLLREKLDAYAKSHPEQFTLVYLISKADEAAAAFPGHESGRVNKELIEKYMPKPDAKSLIYTCGPPAFMNLISGDKQPDKTQGPLIGLLKDLGYESSMVCKQ